MNAIERKEPRKRLRKRTSRTMKQTKILKVILVIQESKRGQQWEGSELFLPLCGVTFVFFLTRFLKMLLFCESWHWFLLLYAASSVPSQTLTGKHKKYNQQEPAPRAGSGLLAPLPYSSLSAASSPHQVSGPWIVPSSPCGPFRAPFQQHLSVEERSSVKLERDNV